MSQERSEAVVVRGVDFSETSRIVTFLTPDRGKVACLAAGAKRPKSKLASLLDTFNRLEIVYYWKDGRGIQKLGEVTPIETYAAIKSDLAKGMYAAFPLEVASKVAQENEPSHELYEALIGGLDGMAEWNGPADLHSAWQIMRLLIAAGFEPRLDGPVEAGRARFSFESGVVESGIRYDRTITTTELDGLRAMAESRERCPNVAQPGGIFEVLRGYATHHVESEFRSLRVIDQLFGAATRVAPE